MYIIDYNSNLNSDFNNNIEFIYIDLLCNKLSIWLLANYSIYYTKKKHILKTKDKLDKPFKFQANLNEKNYYVI